MAQKLDPRNLYKRICHYGPYIYFCNSDAPGFDRSIVEYMNKLAKEYSVLNVFELDWEIYSKFFCAQSTEEVFNVYLYCKGLKIDEKIRPDENAMNELFEKAIQIHNERFEQRANNVGKRALNIKLDKDLVSYTRELKKRLCANRWRRRRYLESKIIYKHDQMKVEKESYIIEKISKSKAILEKAKDRKDAKTHKSLTCNKTVRIPINQISIVKSLSFNDRIQNVSSDTCKSLNQRKLQNLQLINYDNYEIPLSNSELFESHSQNFLNLQQNFYFNPERSLNLKPHSLSKLDHISPTVNFSYDSYLRYRPLEPKSLKKYFLKRYTYHKYDFGNFFE